MRGVKAVAVAAVAVAVGVAATHLSAAGGGPAAESARLDELRAKRAAWSEYHARLVTELVLGRLTLAEAVDLLLDTGDAHPGWLDSLDRQFPDAPDRRARVARSLVIAVEVAVVFEPDRGAAAGRVGTEYAGMTVGPH